jgi:aminoglycoside phosphotransferase (APT) family kinase protein
MDKHPLATAPRRRPAYLSAMTRSEALPSPGALEEIRRLAGPSAVILGAARLAGGQHADTWRVDTGSPATSVVVRQFPVDDPAPARERGVLRVLDGLGGLSPVWLGGDLGGRWSKYPTSLISWLDGRPEITPADPRQWARELGRALAVAHAVPSERLVELPSVFDHRGGSEEILAGPLAAEVRSRWSEAVASPPVLSHCDYWAGNVVWRRGRLTGIVDWATAARGPRGFDLGWCRLDLVLLFDQQIADEFLAAYEARTGRAVAEMRLWDSWAVARSHDAVASWVPNYLPLGRADLDEDELRRRHARWTARLRKRT